MLTIYYMKKYVKKILSFLYNLIYWFLVDCKLVNLMIYEYCNIYISGTCIPECNIACPIIYLFQMWVSIVKVVDDIYII